MNGLQVLRISVLEYLILQGIGGHGYDVEDILYLYSQK